MIKRDHFSYWRLSRFSRWNCVFIARLGQAWQHIYDSLSKEYSCTCLAIICSIRHWSTPSYGNYQVKHFLFSLTNEGPCKMGVSTYLVIIPFQWPTNTMKNGDFHLSKILIFCPQKWLILSRIYCSTNQNTKLFQVFINISYLNSKPNSLLNFHRLSQYHETCKRKYNLVPTWIWGLKVDSKVWQGNLYTKLLSFLKRVLRKVNIFMLMQFRNFQIR